MGVPAIRQYWSSFGNIFKRKTHPDIRLDYTSARQQVRWLILHVEYAAVVGTPQTDLQRSPISALGGIESAQNSIYSVRSK